MTNPCTCCKEKEVVAGDDLCLDCLIFIKADIAVEAAFQKFAKKLRALADELDNIIDSE